MFLRSIWPALTWALFIMVICGIPGHAIPHMDFWQWLRWDKLVHLGIYIVLAILLTRGFQRQPTYPRLKNSAKIYSLVLCSFYGILIEILQATVFIDRSGDIRDALANTIGALIGVLIFDRIVRFRPLSRTS